MRDMNPYESNSNLTLDANNRFLPVDFVFSVMVGMITILLSVFLIISGLFYGFRWPGATKSAISFAILSVCAAYVIVRGSKELKQLRELSIRGLRVGLIHIMIVFAFGFAVRGFAYWVTKNSSI